MTRTLMSKYKVASFQSTDTVMELIKGVKRELEDVREKNAQLWKRVKWLETQNEQNTNVEIRRLAQALNSNTRFFERSYLFKEFKLPSLLIQKLTDIAEITDTDFYFEKIANLNKVFTQMKTETKKQKYIYDSLFYLLGDPHGNSLDRQNIVKLFKDLNIDFTRLKVPDGLKNSIIKRLCTTSKSFKELFDSIPKSKNNELEFFAYNFLFKNNFDIFNHLCSTWASEENQSLSLDTSERHALCIIPEFLKLNVPDDQESKGYFLESLESIAGKEWNSLDPKILLKLFGFHGDYNILYKIGGLEIATPKESNHILNKINQILDQKNISYSDIHQITYLIMYNIFFESFGALPLEQSQIDLITQTVNNIIEKANSLAMTEEQQLEFSESMEDLLTQIPSSLPTSNCELGTINQLQLTSKQTNPSSVTETKFSIGQLDDFSGDEKTKKAVLFVLNKIEEFLKVEYKNVPDEIQFTSTEIGLINNIRLYLNKELESADCSQLANHYYIELTGDPNTLHFKVKAFCSNNGARFKLLNIIKLKVL